MKIKQRGYQVVSSADVPSAHNYGQRTSCPLSNNFATQTAQRPVVMIWDRFDLNSFRQSLIVATALLFALGVFVQETNADEATVQTGSPKVQSAKSTKISAPNSVSSTAKPTLPPKSPAQSTKTIKPTAMSSMAKPIDSAKKMPALPLSAIQPKSVSSAAKPTSKAATATVKGPAQKTGNTKSSTTKSTSAKKTTTKTTSKAPVRKVSPRIVRPIPAVVSPQGKPIWLSVDDGKRAGKALKKYVIADFYTDWCGWCKVLDKATFKDPSVEAFLAKNAVCMKVNSEDNKSGTALSQEFEVSGWPTVIIFDPAGQEVDRISGFMPAPQFLKWVQSAIPSKK
ncbi:MAG: thioredoxin fold domain-containing protein [Candidatus Obscuribacterales bacterium]|nr:thioredoxin fold domain-containing protein [Candidatus Obscuribacterales bacterium]